MVVCKFNELVIMKGVDKLIRVIGDVCVWWRVMKGKIVLFGFMILDELFYWYIMLLLVYFKESVEELVISKINMDNFVFGES